MNFTKAKYYLMPAAICLIGMLVLCYYYFFSSFNSKDTTQYLYIDNDDTADSIYVKLAPIGSTHSMTGLRTLIRHCSYEDNITRVFHMLKRGHQTPMNLTIPEVRTMELMAGALARKLMLDSLTIVQSLHSPDYCQQLGYDTATIACIFIPNTYEVYWNTTLDVLMKRMKKEHDVFWTEERLQKAKRKGLTPNEVAILASIVDEETTTNAEKPMVAGMYLNRLHKNMPLQADPTVKFAVGDFSLRRIHHKHLMTDSPYMPGFHLVLSKWHLYRAQTPYSTQPLTTISTCVLRKIFRAPTTLPVHCRNTCKTPVVTNRHLISGESNRLICSAF